MLPFDYLKIILYYSSCTVLQLLQKHAKQHDNQTFPDFYEHISHLWNLGAWYFCSVQIPETGSFQHYKSIDKKMEITHKVSKITKMLEYLKNKLRKTGNITWAHNHTIMHYSAAWFGYLWIVSSGEKAALLFHNGSFIFEPPNFVWRWITSGFTLQLHWFPSFFGDVAKQLYESQRSCNA